jgi:hypothetical protein
LGPAAARQPECPQRGRRVRSPGGVGGIRDVEPVGSWRTTPNAKSCSSSLQRAPSTINPGSAASRRVSVRRLALPTPARRSMTTNRPLPPAAAPAAEASAVRSRSRSSSRARGRSSPREAPATAVAHYGEAGRRRSGGTGSMCRATVPRALGAAGEPREGSERERAVRGLIAVVLNDVPIDVLANRSGQAQVDVVCFNVMVHRPHRLAGIIVTCSRTRASTTSRCVTSG